jgi:serine phosphatase RsbU (regulator of sigma subunit)
MLWAVGPSHGTLNLAAIATLFQQRLALLQKHQEEVDSLAEQLLETYEEINLFYELADTFEIATNETQLGETLLRRALSVTSGDGGAVVLVDNETAKIVAASGELSDPLTSRPLTLFPTLENTLQRGVAHNISVELTADSRHPDRPTLIAPVLIRGKPIGAVVLQKQSDRAFDAGEMKIVCSLSAHAGVFLNNLRQAQRLVETARLSQQLEFAETVQRQLLPATDLKVPGLDIAVAYLASNQVGGDYYDVFDIAPHAVGAVIADVSGHSIASGLLMTAARSAVRLLVRHLVQPAKILHELNETLYRDLDQTDLLISLFLMILDLEKHIVRYASAGHNPPFLYQQATGKVVSLDATGTLLGITPEGDFDEIALPFVSGDALVLYTDGITEARNPQGVFFGESRLQTRILQSGQARAQHIVGSIMTDVRHYTANHLDDDMTLLVLKLASEP